MCRAFNIFQVYQYFIIYRQYFFIKMFMIIVYNASLKSGGTKDHFRRVKVPGTAPYWKAWGSMVHLYIT
jgi:hypothetical protein